VWVVLGFLCVGCDRAFQNVTARSPATSVPISSTSQAEPAFWLNPGRYCYQTTTANLTAQIRVNITAKGHISGDTIATIHNRGASYYTSYQQRFDGGIHKDSGRPALAKLKVTTWIEYDVQSSSETWIFTPRMLTARTENLQAADCALVNKAFQNQAGLEATDLLNSATALHRKTIALSDRPTTVQNSVIRGERDVYMFSANGGQALNLTIQSVESNAVFDLISPSGIILAQEAQHQKIILLQIGTYQAIVGGTRGNATYTLTFQSRNRND
jgi:hypothetical protein